MSDPTPRDTRLFDAGAHWATEPTDRRGHGDALRDAVERATTPGDRDRGRELTELATWIEQKEQHVREIGDAPSNARADGLRIAALEVRDRLRGLAVSVPQITRRMVMDAVDETVVGECPGAAVADRLGLTNGHEEGEGRG